MGTPVIERIRAWLVDLPMVHSFTSARSGLRDRRIIVLAIDGGGATGWGEAAPVPGHTTEDPDGAWSTLRLLLAAHGVNAATEAGGLLAAAFTQAADDLSAKLSGEALWRTLGGTPEVMASAAIGLEASGRPDKRQIDVAADSGYRNMKLKITPACTADDVRAILESHPHVVFGADANGSFGPEDRAALDALDSVGLAYLEQPGDPHDLDFHGKLRASLRTPVALDESAADADAIRRILASGAADVITLKTGRLGASRALDLARSITSQGVGVRLGGLVESGIGRAHAAALAGNPVFAWPSDLAASDRYFEDDLVRPQWRITDGTLGLPSGPGIGVAVDRDALDAHSAASLTVVQSG